MPTPQDHAPPTHRTTIPLWHAFTARYARFGVTARIGVWSAAMLIVIATGFGMAIGSFWPCLPTYVFALVMTGVAYIGEAMDDDARTDWRAREDAFLAKRMARQDR